METKSFKVVKYKTKLLVIKFKGLNCSLKQKVFLKLFSIF